MTERSPALGRHDEVKAANSWAWNCDALHGDEKSAPVIDLSCKEADQRIFDGTSIDALTIHGEELPCAYAAANEVRLVAQQNAHVFLMIGAHEGWKCEARRLLHAYTTPLVARGEPGYSLVVPRETAGRTLREIAEFREVAAPICMPTEAVRHTADTELQRTFEDLAQLWRRETSHLSAIAQKSMCPASSNSRV